MSTAVSNEIDKVDHHLREAAKALLRIKVLHDRARQNPTKEWMQIQDDGGYLRLERNIVTLYRYYKYCSIIASPDKPCGEIIPFKPEDK